MGMHHVSVCWTLSEIIISIICKTTQSIVRRQCAQPRTRKDMLIFISLSACVHRPRTDRTEKVRLRSTPYFTTRLVHSSQSATARRFPVPHNLGGVKHVRHFLVCTGRKGRDLRAVVTEHTHFSNLCRMEDAKLIECVRARYDKRGRTMRTLWRRVTALFCPYLFWPAKSMVCAGSVDTSSKETLSPFYDIIYEYGIFNVHTNLGACRRSVA